MSPLRSFQDLSQHKVRLLESSPLRSLLLAGAGGVYIGLGVALILALGTPLFLVGSPFTKLVMAVTFGVALSLVLMGGAELSTGNHLVGAIGGVMGAITWKQVATLILWTWVGNLLGSLLLAWMVVESGVLSNTTLLEQLALVKMTLDPFPLVLRGLLCNWLVCLALWTASRTDSDGAKLLMIFWCLLAFVGTGFEHSVANQSLLAMALWSPHGDALTWTGYWYNQFWVVLGNLLGGGLCVGAFYAWVYHDAD